jgi:ketosteroid isomerase-like protein
MSGGYRVSSKNGNPGLSYFVEGADWKSRDAVSRAAAWIDPVLLWAHIPKFTVEWHRVRLAKRRSAMHRQLILIIATLMATLATQGSRAILAQMQDNAESEIQSLDARRLRALTQGDVQALDQILSKDLIYTHASGWRQTKAEFLASIRSGELKYHVFTMHEERVRPYGNTVIVTGDASAKVKAKRQELDIRMLFLEAYVRQDGRLQLVAWQSTRFMP